MEQNWRELSVTPHVKAGSVTDLDSEAENGGAECGCAGARGV
jgi:hypothetical protein